MTPDREVPRPSKGKYRIVAADKKAKKGWNDLARSQTGNMQKLWDILNQNPTDYHDHSRQHPLKGSLGRVTVGNVEYRQWQHELAGGARVWFVVDEESKTVYLTRCSTRHPNETK